jgi:hypothetical protein
MHRLVYLPNVHVINQVISSVVPTIQTTVFMICNVNVTHLGTPDVSSQSSFQIMACMFIRLLLTCDN